MSAPPILQANDLTVRIGKELILDRISLSLDRGRMVALVGPNGAGKTTLLRALLGLAPSEGEIRIDGAALADLPSAARARSIAYLPQGHQVHWPLAARDVVALGRYPHGLVDPLRMSAEHAAVVDGVMARTDTAMFADRSVQTLSGGERARVMMARVLAVEAPILFADEPTASLDPRHQLMVMSDLKAEAQRGALVIAVTHDLGLAARMANDIVLLSQGRLVAHGSPREVFSRDRLKSVYGVSPFEAIFNDEMVLVPWSIV